MVPSPLPPSPPTAPPDGPPALPVPAVGSAAGPGTPDVASGRSGALARRVGFAGPVLTALVLNCWRLSGNGLGNTYYAAAVRAMTHSWRNFFFGAFDPGGFITVDKPPMALWFQAASAKIFGFSSWSLLLPGALAGAASVALLWAIVHRRFGTTAATVAASALALSPINVAVNRINLPEPFMIFFLLAAVWALLRSFEAQRWARWLVLAGVFFGAAFDAKMLAAAIPAPAFGLGVLLGSPGGIGHRTKRAAVLAAAALAFALPWMTIVDLTPASARPYVGGSSDNTERNLILGYNGIGRVDGQGQLRGGGRRGGGGRDGADGAPQFAPGAPSGGFGGSNGPGGIFGGAPGTFRLFSDSVGPQIAWLIPAALLAALVALWHHRRSRAALGALALWTGWVALHAVVFSYAKGIFHSYYTSALAPGLAALVGIGAAAVLAEARRDRAWLAYAGGGVVVSAGLAVKLSHRAGPFFGWTRPTVVALTALTVIGLVAVAAVRRGRKFVAAPLTAALAALLITPLNATLPQAGPRGGAAGATFGSAAFDANAGLAKFLAAHNTGQRWDLAATNAMSAADLIASYRLSVMALGGFLGSDPAATVSSVATMVGKGEVRYFLTGGGFGRGGGRGFGGRFGRGGGQPPRGGFGGFGGGTADQVMTAVQAACTPVSSTTADGKAPLPSAYDGQLYDCAGRAAALAARA